MSLSKLKLALLSCAFFVALTGTASAFAPMSLGIHDPGAEAGAESNAQLIDDANAQISRRATVWSGIAPGTRPTSAEARDPGFAGYNWTSVDAFVKAATARGQQPLLTVYQAPEWAEGDDDADRANRFGHGGTYRVRAADFGDFMFAMATRYSGKYNGLPRVKYFQMWNEPNFAQYLVSQKKTDIPIIYNKLLNAGYDAVKSVSKSNLVISAGMGPFGNNGAATDVDPQIFMRAMLCLRGSAGKNLKEDPGCIAPKPRFDVWAQHPYTFAGDPTTRGASTDAAALGNMIDIKRTLAFAVKKGNAFPAGRKRLWVTEFAWWSDPPGYMSNGQQIGKPLSVQAAYTSETIYRLWKLGFSAFVWYSLYDLNAFPSGLYVTSSDGTAKPKPALSAFRFPFYADQSGSKVLVWGLVSGAGKSKVRVEKKDGRKWRKVIDLTTDSQGMFTRRVTASKGTFRARALSGGKKGEASLGFKAR